MKKNSVNKKESKSLSEETRSKYKAIIKVANITAEHCKYQAGNHQEKIRQYEIIVEHYEFKITQIKLPGKGPLDQDLKTKEVLEDIRSETEYSQVILREHKEMIASCKDIVALCKKQALVYERREKKYKALLFAERD